MANANSLIFLGTGGGVPSAERAGSGLIARVGESLTWIDCGNSTCQSFLRCGLDPAQVDNIVISHTHPDHVCELPMAIQMVYLSGRTEPLSVFVPEEFVDTLKKLLPAMYLFRSRMPFELRITGYSEGVLFSEPFQLRAIPNRHLQRYAELLSRESHPNKMQSFSFSMSIGSKRVYLSNDIADIDDIAPHLPGHDMAIVEAAHVDIDGLLKLVPPGVGTELALTHVLGTEVKRLPESARGVKIAQDGMVLGL